MSDDLLKWTGVFKRYDKSFVAVVVVLISVLSMYVAGLHLMTDVLVDSPVIINIQNTLNNQKEFNENVRQQMDHFSEQQEKTNTEMQKNFKELLLLMKGR